MAKPSSRKKKSLVVVESPAKAKTINKYLGPDYEVKASMGHVRDLPSSGLNVDIENDFQPTYEVLPGKKRTVNSLKAAAKKCDRVFLATDLDREGEAIAWHVARLLGTNDDKTFRVIFNAITQSAIKQAFAEPGKLDMDKVMAQQARRVLDRIVGYKISPLLWKKVARGLSAGRVQSVAVKMIVQREREIRAFKPTEYWLIPTVFSTDLQADYTQQWRAFMAAGQEEKKSPTQQQQNDWLAEHNAFLAELEKVGDEKFKASNEAQANKIYEALKSASWQVDDVQTKRSRSRPGPPFITSVLQQAAATQLGFSPRRTMRIAQQLYEGIEVGTMGSLGLITYMRTDSTHLSPEALSEARHYIQQNIGKQYLPEKAQVYASKKTAQQAHEAIRPTDCDYEPKEISQFLTDEQYKLYDLIWRRFLASQMSPAQWDLTTVRVAAPTAVGKCVYKATGRTLVFDGYTRLWPSQSNEPRLPKMQTGENLAVVDIRPQQHFTKPPPRYSEASLVRALEKEGIGRPSTYAAIISTIQERGYVENADRRLVPTDVGEIVTEKLDEYFPRVMDLAFTRHMETQLDKIEDSHLGWVTVLQEFYQPFKENLDRASEMMKHAKAETRPSEYKCPDCGQPLVYRFGKKGRFLSCSAYPKCKFAAPCDKEGKMLEEKETDQKCPNCGAPMKVKYGRYGPFLGCSRYPECKTILKLDKDGQVLPPKPPPEPTGVKCYKCKSGELVVRQSKRGPFLGCSRFPKCRTIVSIKQLDKLKRLQAEGKWPPEKREDAENILGRKKSAGKKNKKKQ